ncbi:aldolase catalytic domain-containing protein [Pseudoxanthomonas sp. Root630]|uniref:aldolase catalytic domain-containing protein n=1 Tax=Pseudoxanthomonas sp. Root630 TaxID=1736574 RepID=UPI000702B166|nr:aldolase catalytic domain-containing protein [Pseudoxanthomonas sp. Root630]KRA46877.1 aldolase [Pseudoxanthomonas sp. Root630]
MARIRVIDCTLRDGGYYNAWNFDVDLVNEYLAAMHAAGVDYVEVGFRSFEKSGFKGACAYTTDNYIRTLKIPEGQVLGVMVNAAEIVNHPAGVVGATSLLFSSAHLSPVDLVRFACHFHEFEATLQACDWLKANGYRVGINLMQVADRTEEELHHIGRLASAHDLDVLYFADSLGSMDAAQTERIVRALRVAWSGEMGIHTHDNMGRAVSNTLKAVECGVAWVDSTVTGMGRGPGNAQTEYVLMELEAERPGRMNLSPLMSLIRRRFGPMQFECGWGKNPYYFLSGKYGIHPTYIQEMLSDPRYGEAEILSVIDHLRQVGGKKFRSDLMEQGRQASSGASSGGWRPDVSFRGRDVLIIGAGPSAAVHAPAIEDYVLRAKPIVMVLNTSEPVRAELVDYRVACHAFRLMADSHRYEVLGHRLIAPVGQMDDSLRDSLGGVEILDFGLSVESMAFEFRGDGAVVPTSLAIAYALAVCSSGHAKAIKLAGFDGFSSDDPRQIEMSELFAAYAAAEGAVPLESITPTSYKIPVTSVYAL